MVVYALITLTLALLVLQIQVVVAEAVVVRQTAAMVVLEAQA